MHKNIQLDVDEMAEIMTILKLSYNIDTIDKSYNKSIENFIDQCNSNPFYYEK
tara:strand:+ start:653 stop:811 length:159 start_codon:yes stop_codon:yes gene_type:complete